MSLVLYPAILERGEGSSFAVWLPDWPGVVAGGLSQSEAVERAERALAVAAEGKVERGEPMPRPSALDGFSIPPDCDFVVRLAIKLTPPDISERVNVYLPKSLIEQVDKAANEWGMTRSSFFGLAVRRVLYEDPSEIWKSMKAVLGRRR